MRHYLNDMSKEQLVLKMNRFMDVDEECKTLLYRVDIGYEGNQMNERCSQAVHKIVHLQDTLKNTNEELVKLYAKVAGLEKENAYIRSTSNTLVLELHNELRQKSDELNKQKQLSDAHAETHNRTAFPNALLEENKILKSRYQYIRTFLEQYAKKAMNVHANSPCPNHKFVHSNGGFAHCTTCGEIDTLVIPTWLNKF